MYQTELPIDEPKQPVTVQGFNAHIKALFEKRALKSEVEAKLTEINKEIAAMEAKSVEYLNELGQDSFKSPFGTVFKKEVLRVTLPQTPEDKAAFAAWVKEQGLEHMMSMHSQTLQTLYKSKLDEAIEKGEGFDFKIPGIAEPKRFEALGVRRNS